MPAFLLVLLIGSVAHAQERPPIADPWHGYLVRGRVLFDDGAPAAGVLVERASSATSARPYSEGAYRTVTDARGLFRFEHAGLGPGTGRTWYLAVHRAGCAPVVITVELHEGTVQGREGDVATGIELRVPRCLPRPGG